ncbi:hypothetical protein [Methanohalobium sp.]|uniref:hypothetical protein n=1 Tax=Methanohalobium sp. TaxID=2837493 RepID=UPI0025E6A281|nr:hypothetical protein [Methanohalobium sp.]
MDILIAFTVGITIFLVVVVFTAAFLKMESDLKQNTTSSQEYRTDDETDKSR